MWEYNPATVSTSINNNSFDSNGLLVYPNPVKGNELFISSIKGFTNGTQIHLINSLGQTVVTLNSLSNQNKQSIDVENIPVGSYFVKVS